MFRPTAPGDVETLVQITAGTGVFKPMEVETLRGVFADYFATEQAHGHHCITMMHHDQIAGFAYYAPVPMTENSWHLYWIVVISGQQARGLGGKLLTEVERAIRSAQGRILFIETSSLPHYEKTRRFYVKNGYDKEAVLRDFYAPGDDMVIFRKPLT
jgi:GNAT superfamily N-acetyltransferase